MFTGWEGHSSPIPQNVYPNIILSLSNFTLQQTQILTLSQNKKISELIQRFSLIEIQNLKNCKCSVLYIFNILKPTYCYLCRQKKNISWTQILLTYLFTFNALKKREKHQAIRLSNIPTKLLLIMDIMYLYIIVSKFLKR